MADVEVTYNNNKIVELSESGTKTLKTAGKYLEDDIVLEYEKPAGGVVEDPLCFLFTFQNTTACTAGPGGCVTNGNDSYVNWSSASSGYYSNIRTWTGLNFINYNNQVTAISVVTAAHTGDTWSLEFFLDWREQSDYAKITINFAGFSFVRKETTLQGFQVDGSSVSLQSHTYSHASHMAFVYTGEALRIFENGSLVDAVNVSLQNNPQSLTISLTETNSSKHTNVELSNLRLVSKVLGTADSFPAPEALYTGNEVPSSVESEQTPCLLFPRICALPDTYQQVKYLQSSGSQHIVTSVPISSDIETRCIGEFTGSNAASVSLIGGRNNNSNNGRYIPLSINANNTSNLRWSYSTSQVDSSYKAYTINHIIFNDSNHKVYLNSVQIMDASSVNLNTDSQQNITLFGMSGYSGVSYRATGRLYYVAFYNNETGALIGDYVPCYRKSDNKPGMYDIVTDTFFTNGGTGEFTLGADV